MSAKTYSSRTADKFVLRLLDGMREEIKSIADSQHRSMNSEIVSWIEMMLEIHKQTGVIPNLDSLRSTAELEAQNRVMRALFLRLLEAGSWHYSAVEFDSFDHHVSGEKFEAEIKEVLALPKPVNVQGLAAADLSDINSTTFEKLEALIKTLPKPYGPDYLPPKPRFKAGKDEAVSLYVNGKYKLGVVKKIWVDTYGGFEEFRARVELNGGGCTEVSLRECHEPDSL